MAIIVTRSGKGSPLTNNEVDANFVNLNTELGTKADTSSLATVATTGAYADLTGKPTIGSADGSVSVTGTTNIDLSVAVAGSTSNVLLPVRNTTGATLTKGTAVYISGATGQISTVSKAIATGDATSAQTLGLVTDNIANNANGNVTLIGTITNIDTSAYTDGQQLYLSPTTAGTLTATKPYAPQHLVYIAVVEHAHPSQGKLFVKVQNGYEMDELHDVAAQTPSNNDGLFYNTSTSLWESKSIVAALGYTPYNSTNPSGYITGITSGNVTTALGFTPANKAGDTFTGPVTVNSGANQVILGSDGAIELTRGAGGPYIDFKDSTAEDFDVRLQASGNQLNIAAAGGLTLNGAGVLTGITSGQVTTALGYTPYNATNPAGYITSSALSAYLPLTGGSLNVGGVANSHQFLYNESGGEIQLIDSTGAGPILIDNVSGLARFYKVGSGAMSIGTTGANYLQYITNGAERMRIDSSGNVGIGTASPSYKLQVASAGAGASEIVASNSAGGERIHLISRNSAGISYAQSQNSQLLVGTFDNYALQFMVNNTTRMIVDTSGNCGIGTNSPARTFSVYSASSIPAQIESSGSDCRVSLFTSSGSGGQGFVQASSGALLLGSSNTERMRIDSSGNLLVGTTSVSGKFTVDNTGASTPVIFGKSADQAGARIAIANTNGQTWHFVAGDVGVSNSGLSFYDATAAATRMRIDSSGNVGIGTASPANQLDVVGTASARSNVSTGNSPLVAINTNTGSNTTKYTSLLFQGYDTVGTNKNVGLVLSGPSDSNYVTSYMAFQTRSADALSERMRIDNSGNVGIGTSSPSYRAHVVSATDYQGYFYNSASATGALIGGVSGAGTITSDSSATPLTFGIGGTERMRIGSNGGIAIGGTGTDATLHIQSAVGGYNRLTQMAPSGTSKDAFNIMAAKNSGGSDLWWSWGVDTSNRWRINQGLGFANNGIIMDDVGQITSADVAAAFGYKGLPQNQRTGAYTLALSDIGKHLYVTAGAFAVTIPADATLNFPVGAAITFVCEDAAKTIVPASGVALVLAGTGAATTGTRTLAIGAVATLIKVQANRWYISGSGVT